MPAVGLPCLLNSDGSSCEGCNEESSDDDDGVHEVNVKVKDDCVEKQWNDPPQDVVGEQSPRK